MKETIISKVPTRPRYIIKGEEKFSETLRRRVDNYFQQTGYKKRGGLEVGIKTATLFILYISTYLLLISNWFTPVGTLFIALVFGAVNVLIVFSIAHDAGHNALFDNPKLNRLLAYSFNLVGASSYLWNITHNQIHHVYPNIGDYDTDIEQQAPLIRVSPTVPLMWFHRFQHLYAPVLYMSYSIFLVYLKDFQDIGILPKKDSKLLENRKHPKREYFVLLASKIIYYNLTIFIPFFLLDLSWQQFLIGFIIVHIFMSALLTIVLIPVHMVDEATFNTVSEDGSIEDNWFIHVFKNTIDYSRKSRLANILLGGLNTHLVHHLFPGVSHVHYIALSEIMKKTADEFDIPYRDVSMLQAIISHFRLLKRRGREVPVVIQEPVV